MRFVPTKAIGATERPNSLPHTELALRSQAASKERQTAVGLGEEQLHEQLHGA
jgi:hypothetical protein